MRKLLLLLLVACIGCGNLTNDPATPDPVRPKAKDNCWEYVARLIEKGKIGDTDLLTKTVENLRVEDAISDAELTSFFDAFKGIRDKQRPIDKATDAATLRGL